MHVTMLTLTPWAIATAPFRRKLFQLRSRDRKELFSAMAGPRAIPDFSPNRFLLRFKCSIFVVICQKIWINMTKNIGNLNWITNIHKTVQDENLSFKSSVNICSSTKLSLVHIQGSLKLFIFNNAGNSFTIWSLTIVIVHFYQTAFTLESVFGRYITTLHEHFRHT